MYRKQVFALDKRI